MALTPKQQRFIAEYLKDGNGKQAAIRAGYSPRSAEVHASRLLRNAQVREAIGAGQAKVLERAEVDAATVLKELLRVATVDVSRAFDAEGRPLPIHQIPEDVRRAIAGVEVERGAAVPRELDDGAVVSPPTRTVKLKFWDKTRALELLGKHLKLFTEKVEHSGAVSIAVVDPYAERKDG